MLNVNPFLHFMILVKIILDKSRASTEKCRSRWRDTKPVLESVFALEDDG